MSSYSLELRELIEHFTQEVEEPMSHTARIEIGRPHLFDFPYPIFDEAYRKVFETNFIREFYMREIGFETEGLFKFRLETWLNINMPYFNKLFESEMLKYDPLTNVDLKVTHNKKNDKVQNDVLDKIKEDLRNKIQNEKRDLLENNNGSVTDTADNTTNKNDNRNIVDSVSKDITRNDTTDRTLDGNENTVNNTDINQTNNIDNTTDSVNDVTNNTVNTQNKNSQIKNINFKRDLESNTPDSRLAITTNDGEGVGVIEYASKIDETFERKTNIGDEKMTDKIDVTSKDTGKVTGKQKGVLDGNENFTGDKTVEENELTTLKSNIQDKLTGNKNDTNITNVSESLNRDIKNNSVKINDDKVNVNVDETGKSTGKDSLTSNVNNIEDFIQHTFGKTGTATFPQLVKEYRESLLRIEKTIFNEMNELFMLVY